MAFPLACGNHRIWKDRGWVLGTALPPLTAICLDAVGGPHRAMGGLPFWCSYSLCSTARDLIRSCSPHFKIFKPGVTPPSALPYKVMFPFPLSAANCMLLNPGWFPGRRHLFLLRGAVLPWEKYSSPGDSTSEAFLSQGASHPKSLQGINRPDGLSNWTGVGIPLDLDPRGWDSKPASGT